MPVASSWQLPPGGIDEPPGHRTDPRGTLDDLTPAPAGLMPQRPLPQGARTFGARLRQIREQRGYSQDAMRDMLHVSQSVYSGWERDRVDVPLSRLKAIALFYDVSLDWLVFGEAGRSITRFPAQEVARG